MPNSDSDSDEFGLPLEGIDDLESDLFGKSLRKHPPAKKSATVAAGKPADPISQLLGQSAKPSSTIAAMKDQQAGRHVTFAGEARKAAKKSQSSFNDDENDDLMDELGFDDDDKKASTKKLSPLEEMLGFGNKEASKLKPKPTTSALDEMLGSISSSASTKQTAKPSAAPKKDDFDDLFGPTNRKAQSSVSSSAATSRKVSSSDFFFGASASEKQPAGKVEKALATRSSSSEKESEPDEDQFDSAPQRKSSRVDIRKDTQAQQLQRPSSQDQQAIRDANKRIAELEIKVEALESENATYRSILEAQKENQKDEIQRLSEIHSSKTKILEEQLQMTIQRLQNDNKRLAEDAKEARSIGISASKAIESEWRNKLHETDESHQRDVEHLKSIHRKALEELRQDQEASIARLKLSMNQQVEAATSAYEHTKTYKDIVVSIETASTELKDLTHKVSRLHESGISAKESNLKLGEDRVQHMQQRLDRELSDLNLEKTKVHELFAKLEAIAREQESILQKDKWDINQERIKLTTMQNSFAEERRLLTDRMEKDRMEINRSKENFLSDQQTLLTKLLMESQNLAKEKSDFIVRRDQDAAKLKQEAILVEERFKHVEAAARNAELTQRDLELKRQELIRLEEEILSEAALQEKIKLQLETDRTILVEERSLLDRELMDAEMRKIQRADKDDDRYAIQRQTAELEAKLASIDNVNFVPKLHQMENSRLTSKEQKLLEMFRGLSEERKQLNVLRESMTCASCRRNLHSEPPFHNSVESVYEIPQKPYESPPMNGQSSFSRQNSMLRRKSNRVDASNRQPSAQPPAPPTQPPPTVPYQAPGQGRPRTLSSTSAASATNGYREMLIA